MITNIEIFTLLSLSLLVYFSFAQDIVPDACLQFRTGSCTRCQRQTHLFDGICYKNIFGCIQYKDGKSCVKCEDSNFKLINQTCQFIGESKLAQQLKLNIHKYSGQSEQNPGDRYGESSFIPSSYETVFRWPTFLALDNYIRKGQYSHYISRMSNPVYSVHLYKNKDMYSYKVLYHGSGGGLFLCIADIEPNLKVQLRSLAPISASNVVYNCYDYDLNGKCLACRTGNHLQSGKCYLNYGGCVRYNQNICIECMDYYFLVENRCTSDCVSVSDSRSILHYGEYRNVSTLERYYNLSITIFYNIKVTTKTITIISTTQAPKQTIDAKLKIISLPKTLIIENKTKQTHQVQKKQDKSLSSEQIDGFIVYSLKNSSSTNQKDHQSLKPLQNLQMQIHSIREIEVLDGQQKIHERNVKNCLKYNSHNLCLKCQQFYFVNQIGNCQQVSALCLEMDEEGKCTKCFEGYNVSRGRCNVKLS